MNELAGDLNVEEYKTLRDETMKRIDARNQILSYTLVFAASMFTLALGQSAFSSALLVYPIVAFFFATSFAFNSLVLIEIGAYLRSLETRLPGAGWANYLKPRYWKIEIFELIASAGLFIGTECIGIGLYSNLDASRKSPSSLLPTLSWIAVGLTVVVVFYPWVHHRLTLRSKAA
jgi:hypothetical protein